MIVKIKDKEYQLDGYVNPINSIQQLAEECYEQGRADREKEVLCYLVDNGYIKYGFSAEYLEEQMKRSRIMNSKFSKCFDDWGNLKDNALHIAYNIGKKEGFRKGKKQGRAEAIESAYYVIKPFMSIEEWKSEVNYQIGLKEQKNDK